MTCLDAIGECPGEWSPHCKEVVNSCRQAESITNSMQREEMPRPARVGFQFLAQPQNMRVDRSGIRRAQVAPHRFQNHVAREIAPRVQNKERQKFTLGRCQIDFSSLARDDSVIEVDLYIGESHDVIYDVALNNPSYSFGTSPAHAGKVSGVQRRR